jgi:DNA/RNA endonuclease YhcR with UshA esterase domain
MRLKPAAVMAVFGLCATTLPASAHHSFAGEFDVDKPIKLQGTITKVEWINPHAWIHIDVKKPDGSVESWAIEGGTPNTLFRRGFTRDSVKAGMVIHVDGYLARDGTNKANGRDLTLPDGRKLFLSGPATNEQPNQR